MALLRIVSNMLQMIPNLDQQLYRLQQMKGMSNPPIRDWCLVDIVELKLSVSDVRTQSHGFLVEVLVVLVLRQVQVVL
jgi:hypothetical protein